MKWWSKISTKGRQVVLAYSLGAVGVIFMGFLLYTVFASDIEVSQQKSRPLKKFITATKRLNPQEVWVEKMGSEAKSLADNLEKMKLQVLEEQKERRALEKKLDEFQAVVRTEAATKNNIPAHQIQTAYSIEQRDDCSKLEIKSFELTPKKSSAETAKTTVENTIPAGAFVKAVFLSGVDASASTSSASDPRPVLLRLTDKGTLPRRFKSDLKGCHILASAYGDLSSERVYMRTEKLTCTEPLTGEIVETQVAGYISGEDGRAGVRGHVVDRAGPIIRNTFVSGFLSGVSNFFGAQQQKSVFPVSPFGQTNALSLEKMAGAGAAQGTTGAMDKLSEFYIKRAEQLQPVIQISAGREVDVIFTQGTPIGSSGVKKVIASNWEITRQKALDHLRREGSKEVSFTDMNDQFVN